MSLILHFSLMGKKQKSLRPTQELSAQAETFAVAVGYWIYFLLRTAIKCNAAISHFFLQPAQEKQPINRTC